MSRPLPLRRIEAFARHNPALTAGLNRLASGLGLRAASTVRTAGVFKSLATKIGPAMARRSLSRARLLGSLLVMLAAGWFAPGAFAATGTCGAATGQGAGPADYPTYCWIDFTNYSDTAAASGQPFTITLPGGSTLSFTITVSTGGVSGTGGLFATTVPTWAGAAFGQTAFTGVPGNPALYQSNNGTTTTVTLSNIVLTVGSGTVPYAIVAADAESTNNAESLSFTTNGNPWTLLASMPQGGVYPTLSGVGTTTVTETGVAGTVGAYAFATQGSPTTISSTLVGGGLQGIAFAVKFHAADFAITSTPSGSFAAGGTGTYTLGVTSNGPDTYSPTDTITVTDALPTGLSYSSASGTGWTCGDAGQVVTCTASNVTVASGGSLPNITLNVTVANTVTSSVTNTATVASNPNLDYNTANNTATNVTTIVEPDLTTSTKSVINTNGGDYAVGDTVQYTITLVESAGAIAVNASVTDTVAATLSNVTVTSFPGGATNSSSGNNINVTGITVPASGSVTVVFTATVAAGTANCTQINNVATITNPNGTTTSSTATAPTVTVAQSSCVVAGNKPIYPYDTLAITRVAPTAAGAGVTVNGNNRTTTWSMSGLPLQEPLQINAGTGTFNLIMARTGSTGAITRSITATLQTNTGAVIGTGSVTFNTTATTLYTITFTTTATLVPAGGYLQLLVNNNSGNTNRSIRVSQYATNYVIGAGTGTGPSTVTFPAGTNTNPLIFVNSVTAYNATYPATTTTPVYVPGATVYICAVVNDPFGPTDVGSAIITITDPSGAVEVAPVAMSENPPAPATPGSTNCDGSANKDATNTYTLGNSYEYKYVIPTSAKTGFWTASVTGYEGADKSANQTANTSFDVDMPDLLVMKTVSVVSDPAEGTTRPKAIPGAIILYTILVQNNGRGPADSGSLVITDPVPANTTFYLTGATPFTFTNGSTASGLSAPVMTFSTTAGAPYTYSPTCTRPCTDTAIKSFQITFTGSLNGKTGSTAPSFTITYQVLLQ
ncbi:MAG TPA: CshA/CshB family fibrillar adhesin-related protein [Gammaproteobacteria bacterium]|nr:CshA/CshB family fibrillar adhesin-related protein [Gammaproteobacteria bacterium]